MMWLRKSKKGFTLIELMVVVAIIGVLALLGLRLYTGQQLKAKNAIVKANAGTIQTLIQAELADSIAATVWGNMVTATTGIIPKSGIHNPAVGGLQTTNLATINAAPTIPTTTTSQYGQVYVYTDAALAADITVFYVNGIAADGTTKVYSTELVARP